MSYINKILLPSEEIIYEAKVHPAIYVAMIPLFIILECVFYYIFFSMPKTHRQDPTTFGYIMLLLPFTLFIQSWLFIKSTELAITSERIICKTGILRTQTSELQLTKVESIEVDQSLFGKLLNYGSVQINGTGSGSSVAPGIIEPFEFRKKLQTVIR